jgi:predicted dehydrogenase
MGKKNGRVRYAVVGLGYISQIAILPAFAHARSNSTLTALVSGDPKKLKSLSRKYGTKHNYSYEQYADCLASGGRDDQRFREVPATTTSLLKFPGDRLASFTCSLGITDRSIFEVIGTKGVLKMDPAYEMVECLKTEITHGEHKQKKTFPKRDQFAAELVYFSDCVLNDTKPEPSGEDGLADVRIIQALLKSAEENRPVSLKQPRIPRRPSMRQEIARAPVRRPPQLVNAQSPGRE